MKILLSHYIPWSITADVMKAYMVARNVRIAYVLYYSRSSQLKKCSYRKIAVDIVFQRKKKKTQIEQKMREL
jgi:hypothetical protein